MKSLMERVKASKEQAKAQADFRDEVEQTTRRFVLAESIRKSPDGGLLVHVKAEARA